MANIDNNLLAEYVELSKTKRSLEAELKDAKRRLGELEPKLLDQFAASAMQRCHVAGLTVYVHRQLWAGAKDGDNEALIAGLDAAGLGDDLVKRTVNKQTLSAWAREIENEGGEFPEEVKEVMTLDEVYSLRTRA